MKNKIGTPAIIAIIAVLLVVIGGAAWKMLGPSGTPEPVKPEEIAHYQEMMKNGGKTSADSDAERYKKMMNQH